MEHRAFMRRSIMDKVVDLVCREASTQQWIQWLRVPLEHAAAAGDFAVVKDLLAAGADGKAGWKGCRDRSLLYAAVEGGNDEVVSAMLMAGSKPDVNVCSVYCDEWSPLHCAVFHGHQSIVKMLLLAGADVEAVEGGGHTPLDLAIRGGNVQVVSHLLMSGAHVNFDNGDGVTPLHMAISLGQEEMVAPLLMRGATVDVLNDTGQSPLLVASEGGYLTAVRALLTAGADFNLRDNSDSSVLEVAAEHGHVDVIRELLQHGADVKSADSNGWTPLHAAVYARHASAVDMLADAGADVNARGGLGDGADVVDQTPLHLAVDNGAVDATLVLLRHQANLEEKDDEGRTLLVLASQYLWVEEVDILLRWGADETVVDTLGQSAIDTIGSRLSLEQRSERNVDVCRVRKLLENAPSDRAWRRRGLLILCRALVEKRGLELTGALTASDSVECTGGASAVVISAKKCCGAENNGTHNVNSDTGDSDEAVASTVEAMMVGLDQDSLFRAIVSFL